MTPAEKAARREANRREVEAFAAKYRSEVTCFLPYKGKCPQCGGKVRVVEATMFDMPAPPPGKCFYAAYIRNGMKETAGVCTRGTN